MFLFIVFVVLSAFSFVIRTESVGWRRGMWLMLGIVFFVAAFASLGLFASILASF